MKTLLTHFLFFGYVVGTFSQQPNVVFILTDDQDSEMDSLSAMPKLLSLIGDKGATFVNSFVASPLCCPSRSSIFTGQYVHNHGAFGNYVDEGCGSLNWQNTSEKNSFPNLLNNAGYTTFHAGKYLNTYGDDDVGGLSYIPAGWDSWIGLKGNSEYYNYYLSVNGTSVYHGNNSVNDYLTLVIKNEAINFIETLPDNKPFFMMLSPPACHDPFTPEPQYANSLNTSSIPRTSNFNIADTNKNWFVELGEQPLRQGIVDSIEETYRNRLRTLMTVDDMIESVVQSLENRGFLNNTYIFYTSDHGFHLGQFSLPIDKRQPYEFDIRVPFLVRGPGISEGIQIQDVTTNIDLAPTILSLAGVPIPRQMDGISLADVLINQRLSHPPMERSLLIEYTGHGIDGYNEGCEYLGTGFLYCWLEYDCKCFDAKNNTYNCIRNLGSGTNEIYCAYDEYNFEEYYNITTDLYQLTNSRDALNTFRYNYLSEKLALLMKCSGSNCNNITSVS